MSTNTQSATKYFVRELKRYKKLIDEDIEQYAKQVKKTTLQLYGAQSRIATDAYLEILKRGGKRIRGALVMLGYEMMGGHDKKMILEAARAIEMVHAYILIMDDIQDRSLVRRGGPTAHIDLAGYHKKHHLSGDDAHFGVAIALNAMGIGNHAAQMIMANLDVDEELRLKAISILNRTMIVTAHGQTSDIMNEVSGEVSERNVQNVLEWKTAHYTILNPLHVGMVLAGADCSATDAITDYAKHTGLAFQITDDIIGVFGDESASGKSPYDDIREGKRTVLTVHALKHAQTADKNFLIQMLGNDNITKIEFERCKDILIKTGALEYAQKTARGHVAHAQASLAEQSGSWSAEGTRFLEGLTNYLLTRAS